MRPLIRTMLSQSGVGNIIYQTIETPDALELNPYAGEFRALVTGAFNYHVENRKATEPTYQPPRFDVEEVILDFFKSGMLVFQVREGHLIGFALLSLKEGSKPIECEICEIYVSQDYRNQGFETLFLAGLIEQIKTAGVETVKIEVEASNDKMMESLANNHFEPQEITFRLNLR